MSLVLLKDENEYVKAKENSRLSIIDYFADWCGPCKLLMPIIEDLAKEYSGEVDFYKFDTQENYDVADNEDLPGLPVVRFYKAGKMLHEIYGNNLDEMVTMIKKHK